MKAVIDFARDHLGYRARSGRVTDFGARLGHDGKAWDGAFLDFVYAKNSVSPGTGLVSTTAALAYFTRMNRLFSRPKVGDIVFFAFSTDDNGFGQPHVGLVTEVRDWNRDGSFRAIEGMTASGLAKGPQEADGVYSRKRYRTDVLAFARPKLTTVTAPPTVTHTPVLRPASFQANKHSNQTALLQFALHEVTGEDKFSRGTFDAHTARAVAAYQRKVGILPATGTVTDVTLNRLARDTGNRYFRVDS